MNKGERVECGGQPQIHPSVIAYIINGLNSAFQALNEFVSDYSHNSDSMVRSLWLNLINND